MFFALILDFIWYLPGVFQHRRTQKWSSGYCFICVFISFIRGIVILLCSAARCFDGFRNTCSFYSFFFSYEALHNKLSAFKTDDFTTVNELLCKILAELIYKRIMVSMSYVTTNKQFWSCSTRYSSICPSYKKVKEFKRKIDGNCLYTVALITVWVVHLEDT